MGKNEIEKLFARLKNDGQKALIAYLCAGDPDLETTVWLVEKMVIAGVDLVELGVPFSDPLADGPVIQAASQRALEAGTTLRKVLRLVEVIKERQPRLPLVLMGYYNPFLKYGLETFASDAARQGVSAVIIPDLPFEEALDFRGFLQQNNVGYIPLVAPTTPRARLSSVLQEQFPFVYCVSVTGVTGARSEVPPGLAEFISSVRSATASPLALGFGISNGTQASVMGQMGDAIVVGSAFVSLIEKESSDRDRLEFGLSRLVRELRLSLNGDC